MEHLDMGQNSWITITGGIWVSHGCYSVLPILVEAFTHPHLASQLAPADETGLNPAFCIVPCSRLTLI